MEVTYLVAAWWHKYHVPCSFSLFVILILNQKIVSVERLKESWGLFTLAVDVYVSTAAMHDTLFT